MLSFAAQNLLCLIRPHLFSFVFVSITIGDGSKKYCCDLYQSVLPKFSSRYFIISSLTIGSLIHSEFTSVSVVRECSIFILLGLAVQFSQHH